MGLTRKDTLSIILNEELTPEEKVAKLISAHLEPVNALKDENATLKSEVEKLSVVQQELDDLKAAGGSWKEKYESEKAAFEAYKGEQTAKETRAAKEKAVRAYFESKNITGKNLEIAMRGSRAEIEALDLDGENIKDAAALDALVAGDFAGLVSTTTTSGAQTSNPPTNNNSAEDLGSLSMADYIAARMKM